MLNVATAAAVALLALGASASTPDEIPATLNWEVSQPDGAAPAGSVDFNLGYRTVNGSSTSGHQVALSTLAGLTPAQLAAKGQPVAFAIHRDAGDFSCKGVADQGHGRGTCVYAANAQFPAALAQRGVAGLQSYQQFQLSLHDLGLAYVDELNRQRYAKPTPTDLVAAAHHGAGLKQLQAMDAVGYRFGDVATLVRVRDHGVSARYITELKAYGYSALPASELVRLRDHGVSANYLSGLREQGFTGLQPDDLVRLRDHGVSAGFITELKSMGYDRLAPEELVRLRDHGVSASFIRVANRDGQRLSTDDLIRLRDRGGRD